jgi:hypothetical protein
MARKNYYPKMQTFNARETLDGIAGLLDKIISFEDDLITVGDCEGEADFLQDVLERIREIDKDVTEYLTERGY